jgi:hypothetical protein
VVVKSAFNRIKSRCKKLVVMDQETFSFSVQGKEICLRNFPKEYLTFHNMEAILGIIIL